MRDKELVTIETCTYMYIHERREKKTGIQTQVFQTLVECSYETELPELLSMYSRLETYYVVLT